MNRIGLLDQYTGANLGDAAILEAAIANVRARVPQAEVCLFALYPEESARRHGVPAFPIAGFRLRWYSDFLRTENDDALERSGKPTPRSPRMERVATAVKRVRFAREAFKLLRAIAHWPGRAVRNLRSELGHIRSTYKLLKTFDAVIIAGGGQIDDEYGGPWGHPYTLLKFAVLARLTGTRFLVWSVGVCLLRSRLSKYFIEGALRHAAYRSYRDEGSKKLLAAMSFTDRDPVMPDLAFSFRVDRSPDAGIAARVPLRIGISPIGYLSEHWPRRDLPVFEAYRQALIDFVAGLAQLGHQIVVFTSDDMDLPVARELYGGLGTDQRRGVSNRVTKRETTTLRAMLECLEPVDYVVASRLHGILLSHVLGKPVMAISYERKVDAHMELMQQQAYSVDIRRPNAADWLTVFEKLVRERRTAITEIGARCADFRAKLAAQYDGLLHVPTQSREL